MLDLPDLLTENDQHDFARQNDEKPMDLGVLHFQTCPCEANQHTLFSEKMLFGVRNPKSFGFQMS